MFLTDGARRVPRRRGLFLVLLALVVGLAACASGAAPQFSVGERAGGKTVADGAAPQPPNGNDSAAAPSAAAGRADADLVDIGRQIVKTGEVTVEVPKVADALGRIRSLALQLGGYVGGSQAGTTDDSATLTLRIPASRFEDALAALHELDGKVLAEATREQDVTSAIVDLKARISNLQASEAQYRALLARAEKIQDILDVQARLDQVRGEIEQLSGQLKSVSSQADLATLTVTLTPQSAPVEKASTGWDPGATAAEALAALLKIGQGLGAVAIWFAIVWLPILLVLGIIALIVLRGLLEVRRRMPATPRPPWTDQPPTS